MINVWFAPDVLEKVQDKRATMNTCENCVVQYVQDETRRHGRINGSARVREQLCDIIQEAIATLDPHLRGLLGITYRQSAKESVTLEVRMSSVLYHLVEINPGAARHH